MCVRKIYGCEGSIMWKNWKEWLLKFTQDWKIFVFHSDFPCGSDCKASVYNAGDPGLIPGSVRSSGEGNGNPLQYYCPRIPWTKELGKLQSVGSQRVGHDWATSLSLVAQTIKNLPAVQETRVQSLDWD